MQQLSTAASATAIDFADTRLLLRLYAHECTGRSNIEELEALLYTPSRTMYPTSDFYFAARASGKLTVVIGEVAKLDTTSVVTKTGEAFHADVLIKCVGKWDNYFSFVYL